MSSFTLMMLFSNLENGRAEEEDEQVAAQCLWRKISTKEKATQNSIGKSWNKSQHWLKKLYNFPLLFTEIATHLRVLVPKTFLDFSLMFKERIDWKGANMSAIY